MTTTYAEFLASKAIAANADGINVPASELHPFLHDWQSEIVAWGKHCASGPNYKADITVLDSSPFLDSLGRCHR